MYEAFFGMEHTPFVRNIPPEKLYESDAFRETLGRLCYVADRQMFAVVTADSGCGSTGFRRRSDQASQSRRTDGRLHPARKAAVFLPAGRSVRRLL